MSFLSSESKLVRANELLAEYDAIMSGFSHELQPGVHVPENHMESNLQVQAALGAMALAQERILARQQASRIAEVSEIPVQRTEDIYPLAASA